jgi:hypothetical protein
VAKLNLVYSLEKLIKFFVDHKIVDFDPKDPEDVSLLESTILLRDWPTANALITIAKGIYNDKKLKKIIKKRQERFGFDILAQATQHRQDYCQAQEEVIIGLIESGADCEVAASEEDGYPLGNAIEARSETIVPLLLKKTTSYPTTVKTPAQLAEFGCTRALKLYGLVCSKSYGVNDRRGKRRRLH